MAGRFSVEAVFKAVDKMTAPVSRMQNRVGKFTRSMAKGLRNIEKATGRVISGFESVGKSMIKFGALGAGAVVTAVTLLTREFSKIENAEAAFTPLMGGADKAKKLVDALNQTAATTPFQFENLSEATKQLLPVMNGDIENTIKTVRMLGDTAGGNAQKLDSITRGYTKAMLKGKVDMESLNMIAEAGVPIFTELAASMGTKVGTKFFKMISAGKVTTAQLNKAFEKMTSSGGIFFGGMEIASRTTSGLWSTLMDNISLTAAEIGGVLSPVIKDLIRGAIDIAGRMRAWVKANRELISAKFLEFVNKAKGFFKDMIDRLTTLNREQSILDRTVAIFSKLSSVMDFLLSHGETIAKLITGVLALSVAIKGITLAMTLFNAVAMLNPIGLIVIAVAALVAGFTALVVWIDDVIGWFEKLPTAVRVVLLPLEAMIRAIKWIKDNIGGVISSASKFADSVGNNLANSEVGKMTTRGIATVGGWANELFGLNNQSKTQPAAQVVSPQERVARSIEEKKNTTEVVIKDDTGRAQVTKGGGPKSGVKVEKTGGM